MKKTSTQAFEIFYDGKFLIVETREDNVEIQKEDVIESFHASVNIAEGKKYLLLSLPKKHSTISIPAQREAFTKEKFKYVIAHAIVIQSYAQRIIVNFMLKFYFMPRPWLIVSNKEKAIEWLNEEWEKYMASTESPILYK